MALKIDKTPEGYVRVIENIMSFMDIKSNIILYDMNKRQKKVNDNDWCEMDLNTVDWVIKYYLPKVV